MSPLGFLVVADLVQLLESASRQQVEVAGFRWGGGRRRRALVNRLRSGLLGIDRFRDWVMFVFSTQVTGWASALLIVYHQSLQPLMRKDQHQASQMALFFFLALVDDPKCTI